MSVRSCAHGCPRAARGATGASISPCSPKHPPGLAMGTPHPRDDWGGSVPSLPTCFGVSPCPGGCGCVGKGLGGEGPLTENSSRFGWLKVFLQLKDAPIPTQTPSRAPASLGKHCALLIIISRLKSAFVTSASRSFSGSPVPVPHACSGRQEVERKLIKNCQCLMLEHLGAFSSERRASCCKEINFTVTGAE